MKRIRVCLDDRTARQLEILARDRKRSELIRQAVVKALAELAGRSPRVAPEPVSGHGLGHGPDRSTGR